jgi:DNA-binding SARP family transcriptional activator
MQADNLQSDQLELALLGPPEVRRAGSVVKLRTRKALALLTFLALEGGMQPRARLTALLWPELAETQGRSNLRNTVSYLRETLGDHLVVARDSLGLRDGFGLDYFALEVAGRSGSNLADPGLVKLGQADPRWRADLGPHNLGPHNLGPHNLKKPNLERRDLKKSDLERRDLERAIQAYRGDFLEAFSLPDAPAFDDWVAAQREVARQWLDGALERLLELHHRHGDLEAALDLAKRRLRLEPLNEIAHRQVMQLHLEAGNRAAALEAYRSCRAALQRELGIEPSNETQSLALRLRQGATQDSGRDSAQHSISQMLGNTVGTNAGNHASGNHVSGNLVPADFTPVAEPLNHWPSTLESYGLENVPLVGREHAWSALEAAWNKGQVIYISGEPGVGKTRLALEFARTHGRFVTLRGRPTDANVPYALIARAIRAIGIDRPNLEYPLWARRELSRLVPELEDDDTPPLRSDAERLRLFDAFVAWGLTAFEHHASIVLDDLHLWDVASFEIGAYGATRALERVAAGSGGMRSRAEVAHDSSAQAERASSRDVPALEPLRTIVVLRNHELPEGIKERMRDQLESGRATMIELETLEASDLRGLMLHHVPTLSDQELQTYQQPLYRLTGGNPLFVLEMLRTLTGTGLAALLEPLQTLPRSERITRLIARRLEQLSREAKHLARVAAIAGEEYNLSLAGSVLDSNEFTLLDASEELERAGVLRGGKLAHELLRDTVLEGLPNAAKILLHARVLDSLELRAGVSAAVPAATLAHHAFEAGRGISVVRYSLNAADAAFKLYAMPQAIFEYERVRLTINALGLDPTQARPTPLGISLIDAQRVYANLGFALSFNDRKQRALEVYQEMLQHARTWVHAPSECTALNRLADIKRDENNDLESADALYRQALEIAQNAHDNLGTVETLVSLAWLEEHRWHLSEALGFATQAVRNAQALEDPAQPEWIIEAFWTLFNIELDMGQYQLALEHAQEAYDLALRHGQRISQSHAKSIIAYCRYFLGQPVQAFEDAKSAVEQSREVNYNAGEVFATRTLALISLELGQPQRALEHATQALEMARSRGRHLPQLYALIAVARAYIGLLQPEQARAYLNQANAFGLERADKIPQLRFMQSYINSWLCFTYSLDQDWAAAAHHALQALEIREANTDYHGWFFWGARNAEFKVLARAGIPRKRLERDLEHFQGSHDNPRIQLSVLHARAALEQVFGSAKTALEILQRAHVLTLELGVVAERLEIEGEIAELKK